MSCRIARTHIFLLTAMIIPPFQVQNNNMMEIIITCMELSYFQQIPAFCNWGRTTPQNLTLKILHVSCSTFIRHVSWFLSPVAEVCGQAMSLEKVQMYFLSFRCPTFNHWLQIIITSVSEISLISLSFNCRFWFPRKQVQWTMIKHNQWKPTGFTS
jgi:hypothetical protein